MQVRFGRHPLACYLDIPARRAPAGARGAQVVSDATVYAFDVTLAGLPIGGAVAALLHGRGGRPLRDADVELGEAERSTVDVRVLVEADESAVGYEIVLHGARRQRQLVSWSNENSKVQLTTPAVLCTTTR